MKNPRRRCKIVHSLQKLYGPNKNCFTKNIFNNVRFFYICKNDDNVADNDLFIEKFHLCDKYFTLYLYKRIPPKKIYIERYDVGISLHPILFHFTYNSSTPKKI